MKEIFFATSNYDKFEEAKKILEKYGINLLKSDIEVIEKKLPTEKETAIDKALTAMQRLQKSLIAEDTGIYFEAFQNFPGVNASFIFKTIGYEGVLRLLEGKNRKAFFRTTIAYYEPNGKIVNFQGTCNGEIATKPSKEISFDYDTIFIPEGHKKTFSELTKEEKAKISHRAQALEKFAKWLTNKK
ncbi:RdgB/HAM1 family non-canonical purine NTP pyrophosphatase [Candidatus Woesearchaeota archaeon]|nr:RdgB/HAM1 family non-canonical purine NTP pyrophosphatase [Candidatus Woesearchaeota archaeon]